VVALESIALFRNLGQDELSALRSITREHPLAAGHEIFREGDAGNGLYFVKSGLVEISGLVGGNIRRVFSQLGPGEVSSREMAVIACRRWRNFARGESSSRP
jgi:CRP/FNR family cyclic AMP-dependent transcriptional regulator